MSNLSTTMSIGFPATAQTEVGVHLEDASYNQTLSSIDSLNNVCCLLLQCNVHKRVALRRSRYKGLFWPVLAYQSNFSWSKLSRSLLNRLIDRLTREAKYAPAQLNCSYSKPIVLDIYRFQWPMTDRIYTRVITFIRIESRLNRKDKPKDNMDNQTNKSIPVTCLCQVNTASIIWLSEKNLITSENKFWGPEVWQLVDRVQTNADLVESNQNYSDYTVRD